MGGLILGFGIVAVTILVGLGIALVGRKRAHTVQAGVVPLVYYVTNPCLMVLVVGETDVREAASLYTPLALAVAVLGAAFFVVYALIARRSAADITVGAMASSYSNVGNIGVAVAIYAVGSTAPVVAFLLAQLLVLAPLYLTLFGLIARHTVASQRRSSPRSALPHVLGSIVNPTSLGVLVGALISLIQMDLPPILWEPVEMIGRASIPLMLMIFGMSLLSSRPFTERARALDSAVAVVIKVGVMPAGALILGGPVMGLSGTDLLGVVAMAALPTAQNVLLFARHYGMPEDAGRDTILCTSVLALPATLAVATIIGA